MPQQHQIPPVSATFTTAHNSNARYLTHWERPGIKPVSSMMLFIFVSTEPQWELPELKPFMNMFWCFWDHSVPKWLAMSAMWTSAKPCTMKPSWVTEMWLPLSSDISCTVCPWNHSVPLHSEAALLWFQCYRPLRDTHTLGLCCSQKWVHLLVKIFSFGGPLCDHLMFPKDL